MAKFSECFFCPAPWTSMYHYNGNTTPCHAINNENAFSPNDYLNSEWLTNIKQDMISGIVPKSCVSCKSREDAGLKSTRGAFWRYYNVGPKPEIDTSLYTLDNKTALSRIEIRTTNLCNFKCRMCSATFSSEIAREKKHFSISSNSMTKNICTSPESHIMELKNLCFNDVSSICLTGGEPFLIKEYCDFMDFLIDNDLNKKITIELFTNCSVYNTKFIDRLLKFKLVKFNMSIDGIGKTAEYQRHGTNWSIVRENILKFNLLPFEIWVNTAISSYVLLDVSSLAKFLMELYTINNKILPKCYSVGKNLGLHHSFMNADLRKMAINEINQAVEILTPDNFEILTTELNNIKLNLENTEPIDSLKFKLFTKTLDAMRQESFKDVFGYNL